MAGSSRRLRARIWSRCTRSLRLSPIRTMTCISQLRSSGLHLLSVFAAALSWWKHTIDYNRRVASRIPFRRQTSAFSEHTVRASGAALLALLGTAVAVSVIVALL